MLPFFVDIILEPLRRRTARKRREAAERARVIAEAEKKRLERLAELRKRGCGHTSHGNTCAACYYFNSRNRVSFMDNDPYEVFYR